MSNDRNNFLKFGNLAIGIYLGFGACNLVPFQGAPLIGLLLLQIYRTRNTSHTEYIFARQS